MADVPHFALPFRFLRGRAVEVEQDSPEDIAACVEAALRTRPGQRDERPEYGTPDSTFAQRPVSHEALISAIERVEPRIHLLVEEDPALATETVQRVRLTPTQEG